MAEGRKFKWPLVRKEEEEEVNAPLQMGEIDRDRRLKQKLVLYLKKLTLRFVFLSRKRFKIQTIFCNTISFHNLSKNYDVRP